MSKTLFSEFKPVSSKEWKQKIHVDLKGADYNESLIWNTNEGIDVKPFYHADEFETSFKTSYTKTTLWEIAQTITVTNPATANTIALDAITRGAESIIFNIDAIVVDVKTLLQNINTPILLKLSFLDSNFTDKIVQLSKENNQPISIYIDSIGHLAKTGNWHKSLKEDHTEFVNIIKQTKQIHINSSLYQNAGATVVQQLAYSIAHANEYLNYIEAEIDSETKKELQVCFNTAIGTNYFFEIAKLKALRNLWEVLALEYNINPECKIIATPSNRNKTIYDYNVNLLRTTTECMSAILGGADIISNLAYDSLYQSYNEFGSRISRNQLLILKHESYFNKVNNPTDGTYYIEDLTQQLADKALRLFKDIEASGGFLKQLKAHIIQKKIKESAAKEQADFDNGKIVLIGTNKYPNPKDSMASSLEINPFKTLNKRKTLIEPIIEKRLSETNEKERIQQE